MLNHSVNVSLMNAIKARDVEAVGGIVDTMRFHLGMKYSDIYKVAHQMTGISEADWDQLLYEADSCTD